MKTTITFLSLWFALSYFSVNAQNNPTIDPVADQTVDEDADLQSIILTGLSDGDDGTQTLTLGVSTDNPDLFSVLELNYGTDTTLVYQPAADSCGVADVQITVSDDQGGVTSESFTLNVNCVNDPPTIDQVTDIVLDNNPGTYTVTLTGITAGPPNEPQDLYSQNTFDNTRINSVSLYDYNTDTKEAKLDIEFLSDASGTAWVNIKLIENSDANSYVNMKFNITIDTPTSIKKTQTDKLDLYPNPVSDVLNVTLSENTNRVVYEIYSLNGKQVLSGNGEGRVLQIPVNSMKSGWYEIKIISEGNVFTGRFLVK